MKNNEKNTDEKIHESEDISCSDCGSKTREYDLQTGYVICECGLILEEHFEQMTDSYIGIQNEKTGGNGYGPATTGTLGNNMTTFDTSKDGKGASLSTAQRRRARINKKNQDWAASEALGSSSRRKAERLISTFFEGGSHSLKARSLAVLNRVWPDKKKDTSNIPPVWQPAHPFGVPAAAAAAIKIALEERGNICRPSRLHSLFPDTCENPQKKILASLKVARRRDRMCARARPSAENGIYSLVELASADSVEIRGISREVESHALKILGTGVMPDDVRNWLSNLAWQIGKRRNLKLSQATCIHHFGSSQNMSVYTVIIKAYMEGGVEGLVDAANRGSNS